MSAILPTIKTLTVYNASAGSGKTFTLATEYIKLLIGNPDSYRNILAVTFTNKATEEMKMRILSQLYGISRALPSSEGYYKVIKQAYSTKSEAEVRRNAALALTRLLHYYSYFRVETIDSFFQCVLRNLARELNLTPNLRVGLNDRQVEEQAVDTMVEELKPGDEVEKHLKKYIGENISEDKNWNVIGQVKSFGRMIFNDVYREKSDEFMLKMNTPGFFDHLIATLRQQKRTAEQEIKDYATHFRQVFAASGLQSEDLKKGGSDILGFLKKFDEGNYSPAKVLLKTLREAAVNSDSWVNKTNKEGGRIIPIIEAQLRPELERLLTLLPDCWQRYRSAEIMLGNLYQLRLLGNIERKVGELNELHDRFLLSNTQHLLGKLIADSDSPFVFEKIGAFLEHIMIDEFQDTGTKQWRNFRVLLKDCMHNGKRNLIVGDVKQSIYRWRSGDWRILNNIVNEVGMGSEPLDIRTLDTNYRSSQNIIAFNNAFFQKAIDIECSGYQETDQKAAEQLRNAYADVAQRNPDPAKPGGYVSVTLFEKPTDYELSTNEKLVEIVSDLLSRGIDKSKIAIITRAKRHFPKIANYFKQHLPSVKIVSDEAFQLGSSPAVSIIVGALKMIYNPKDELNKVVLTNLYRREVLGYDETLNEMVLDNEQNLDNLLPPEMANAQQTTSQMSLYERAEWAYRVFNVGAIKGQTEFVCAFYDHLDKFINDTTPSLHSFIKHWDDELHKTAIVDSAVDGIRIVTIHKSKGLEFDHVIIPYIDWKLEVKEGTVIWTSVDLPPYNQLPVIPLNYDLSNVEGTVFEDAYRQEALQNSVDNMNTLYVAFTRAKNGLYVIGKTADKRYRSQLVEATISELARSLDGAELQEYDSPEPSMEFSWGDIESLKPDETSDKKTPNPTQNKASSDSDKDESDRNVFLIKPEQITTGIGIYEKTVKFRQSHVARRFVDSFVADDEMQPDELPMQPEEAPSASDGGQNESSGAQSQTATTAGKPRTRDYIKVGSVLHKAFSAIRTTADIESALDQLRFDGILPDAASVDKMKEMMHKRLSNKRVADWFSGRWRLFNECSILYIDNKGNTRECRPDRVMSDGRETVVVDYKFGKPRPDYREQVEGYMDHLKKMGMPSVKGYLWYVYSNQIEEVI